MKKHQVIIVDECVSPRIALYLSKMGDNVIHIRNGRVDRDIRELAGELDAYVITKDEGFKNYKRLLLIENREHPKSVYWRLHRLMSL